MTDPIKALADAARIILTWTMESDRGIPALRNALAAYDAAQVSQPPSDAEIESFIAKVENVINQMCDPTSPNFARCAVDVRAGCDAIIKNVVAMLRRARPEPSDAELESALDTYRDACYAHARAATFGEDDDEPSTALAADAARKALSSLMRARPDAGLLRTEFGISSYPVPSKASDGWPDNFSVWRLKDGRTRIYRQAVAPTDAEVEGCNATELREALFNRNNDVERLVEQRDGLLRAAKAVLAVDVLMRNAQNGMPAHVFNGVLEVLQEEAIPDLRAEVARVEGKP